MEEKKEVKEKLKKEKNKNSNKILKISLFIILMIVLFAGVSVGTIFFLKSIEPQEVINCSYIAKLEDGSYYIPKAKNNIIFPINEPNSELYSLKDEEGTNIETEIVQKDNKYYIKGKSNYQEGMEYTLELTNTEFADEQLKETKKLIFKIEEPEKEKYELADNVKILEDSNKIQENEGIKTINTEGTNIKENENIIVKKEDKYSEAYKVEKIENNVATLVEPDLSEIYKNIDIYKEYKVDFTKIKFEEDLKDNIILSVKKSPLYQFLVNEVYAEEDLGIEVEVKPKSDSVEIKIKIKVEANGKPFLGIESLKKHGIEISTKIELSVDAICDIELGKNINIGTKLTQKFENKIKLTSTVGEINDITDLSEEEYNKTIGLVIEKLESIEEDKTSGKHKIAELPIPTGVPGINLYAEIYFRTQIGAQVNLEYNQSSETIETVGIMINANSTKPYFNIDSGSAEVGVSIAGKVDAKIGLGIGVGVDVLSRGKVGVEGEIGFYGEMYATCKTNIDLKENKLDDNFLGSIEAGIYGKADFVAELDIIFKKFKYEESFAEIKKALIKIGNEEMLTGITTDSNWYIDNGIITMSNINAKIKNIKTLEERTEKLNYSDLKFKDESGNELSQNYGRLNVGNRDNITVTIEYIYQGNTYKQNIKATKKPEVNNNSSNNNNKTTETNTASQGEITMEQARALAQKRWGTVSDTGMEIGYSYIAKVKDTKGNQYYAFRMSWKVDDGGGASHWSTIDTIFIATDGKTYKEVGLPTWYEDGDVIKSFDAEGTLN